MTASILWRRLDTPGHDACHLEGSATAWQIAQTTGGVWTLNGALRPGLANCHDLDLGFTPATNLLPLRRLALAASQAADAPAAWLDVSAGTLKGLPQRYERQGEVTYWSEADP